MASSMLTIAVAFKNPWRIATDVPLTSKELESAIASASILFWRKNNGACRQHALLIAAASASTRNKCCGGVE